MSRKLKIPIPSVLSCAVLISILAVSGLLDPVLRPIQLKMDEWRLGRFAQRITSADRVVVSMWPRRELKLSLIGEDAKRVIQAVSSAKSGRPAPGMAWANMYLTKAGFFQGTYCVGEIAIDGGELFLAGGLEYRDVSIYGNTGRGVLAELVCAPVEKIAREAREKEVERK